MNTTYAKNRRIRIALLSLLKSEYPSGVDLKVLRFAMDNLGYPLPEGRLEAHLRYLEEKGYAQLEHRRAFDFEIDFASLTADGWDLLDGQVREGGIDVRL